MSTVRTWQTESTSSNATSEFAVQIGRKLRGGEVIVLTGDLGAGKTAFTRGLVLGTGSSDAVRSPSFTVSNQYRTDNLTLYHFDFYRLDGPGIMRDALQEVAADPKAVVIVEWADIIADVLPTDRLTIQITATGDTVRQFTFTCPDKFEYLAPANT